MSTLKVEILEIEKVEPHPNADRLDLVTIKGWQVVTGKGIHKPSDLVVYIPIDSMLPPRVAEVLFPPDSKIKPSKGGRIRTVKIRGAISQGMIARLELLYDYREQFTLYAGQDVTADLGITKYEPPVIHGGHGIGNVLRVKKIQENRNFHKYTGLENFKNYTTLFRHGEEVSVTEKIHGTNFRAGWVKTEARTFLDKVKKFMGLLPEYEFVYGSHNNQLDKKLLNPESHTANVYAEVVVKYDLRNKIQYGQVVYGEIYGDKIQKGYAYGCKTGERKLILFDVINDGSYLSPDSFRAYCRIVGLPAVPELYRGPFDFDVIKALRLGNSTLAPMQKIREGVVIKSLNEETTYMGRKVLKLISEEYQLKNQDQEEIPQEFVH